MMNSHSSPPLMASGEGRPLPNRSKPRLSPVAPVRPVSRPAQKRKTSPVVATMGILLAGLVVASLLNEPTLSSIRPAPEQHAHNLPIEYTSAPAQTSPGLPPMKASLSSEALTVDDDDFIASHWGPVEYPTTANLRSQEASIGSYSLRLPVVPTSETLDEIKRRYRQAAIRRALKAGTMSKKVFEENLAPQ